MAANCSKHPYELSDVFCDRCGHDFCDDCLVWTKGEFEPPVCTGCALVLAGIRSAAAPPFKYEKKAFKKLRKEQRAMLRERGEHKERYEIVYQRDDAPAPAPPLAAPSAPTPADAIDDGWDEAPGWGTAFSSGT